MDTDVAYLWTFLLRGYLFTVAVETPVLLVGLSRPHSWRRRIAAGIWLNACSYPIVVLSLPLLLPDRTAYLIVAETFAPLIEASLFALAFHTRVMARRDRVRDWIAVILANLCSFGAGILIAHALPRLARWIGV
jgi:hypothetical protein